jgi:hypothetical protein
MIVGLIMSSCFQILIIITIRSPRRSAGGRNCSAKVARSGLRRDCLERHRMGRTLLQRLESRMRSILPPPPPTPMACPHSLYSSPGGTVNEDSLSLLMSMIHLNSYPSMKYRRKKKKALLLWKSSCLNPLSVESTSMMSCWTLLLPCPTRIFGGWRVAVASRKRQLSMMWMRKTLPGLNSSTSNN